MITKIKNKVQNFGNCIESNSKRLKSVFSIVAALVISAVNLSAGAGRKYAVLTVKHVAGFCLWDIKYTIYDILIAKIWLTTTPEIF
jgi:hypothetical protein